jgi:hypothetical protein
MSDLCKENNDNLRPMKDKQILHQVVNNQLPKYSAHENSSGTVNDCKAFK